MRKIDLIIVHCADTPNGKHFTVEDIDDWHQDRGFLRSPDAQKDFNHTLGHIGYHFVIYVDGTIHTGRGVNEVGAHAEGYNKNSIGICLIGKDKFTVPQWDSLKRILEANKINPNFDVPAYLANGYSPDPDDIKT
jgi:hypothetical protein